MIEVLLLALALSADAFAAALGQGAASRGGVASALRVGTAFGIAQAVMPLLGWTLGVAFATLARDIDHWIAFVLLSLIGVRMMRAGLEHGEPASSPAAMGLLGMALATSVDAAAAGVTIPALGHPVLLVCAVIGGVTFALSAVGVLLGSAAGAVVGKRAEFVGGLVLLGLGIKIFIDHEFLSG